MRALLVVNPHATTTSARTREVLASALEGELKLDVAHTHHRGHAAELARQARLDGLDLVVVLGGDGTVNEVVNGLLDRRTPDAGAPALAVVPGGGTNVFARALGMPRDPVEATGALLDALRARRSRTIGLGLAGDRWFTFNAGMGWDAEVVARVDRGRRQRGTDPQDHLRRLRPGRARAVLPAHRPPPPGADGLAARRRAAPGLHLAIVANTAPWTYLGDRPLLTSPRACFDTGLDLYALTRLRTLSTLRRGPPPGARPVRRPADGRRGPPGARPARAHPAGRPAGGRPGRRRAAGRAHELTFRSVPDALRVVV